MLATTRSSRKKIDFKAITGTHEFTYRDWTLMEQNKSSHLTNGKVAVAREYFAGQRWHNSISYYVSPSKRDAVS